MTVSLQELFDEGCHLGHQAHKWHPRMKPWIYAEQDGIHLFDLEKTAAQVEKARARIEELKKDGKSVIVVATKKQAAEIVQSLAENAGLMCVVNRWPGGLITNWEQVRKSIKRMVAIEEGLAGDRFKELTKYERLLKEKELARLNRLFGGVKALKDKPDALLIVDADREKNAMREAVREEVEVIAIVDSNTDPTGVAIPVPGNDDAISSIKCLLTAILAVAKGEKEEKKEVEKPEKLAEEKPKKVAVKKETKKVTKEEKKVDTPKKKSTVKKEEVAEEKPIKEQTEKTTKKGAEKTTKKKVAKKKEA